MRPVIVVEGQDDKLLIERILTSGEAHASDFEVFPAGGASSAESLARTILAVKRQPVALVIDADTNSPAAAQEKRLFHETSLQSVAGRIPWRFVLMVPEIETIFFRDPRLTRSLLGPLPPLHIQLGQKAPKETLDSILLERGTTYQRFLRNELSSAALARLATMDEFVQLRDFIDSTRELPVSP